MGLKIASKSAVKGVLARSGAFSLGSRFAAPRAVILMYHSVQDRPELTLNTLETSHSTSVFKRQMEAVARRFDPVTLDDIVTFVKGTGRLPRRSIAVTFDDGFADNAGVVAPALNRYGIRAAFYLQVGLIGTKKLPWYCRLRHAFRSTRKFEWNAPAGKPVRNLEDPAERQAALQLMWDRCAALPGAQCEATVQTIERDLDVEPPAPEAGQMMTWDQARSLQQAGHIIGSHTVNHPNMAFVPEDEARMEFNESKRKLEEELNAPALHFSYPHPALNPQFNEATIALSAAAGYESALLTTSGAVRLGDNLLALKRISASLDTNQLLWDAERALLGFGT
ncbi:MAG: polysaccharide deacetylase family protein [Terriglobia bacterium]